MRNEKDGYIFYAQKALQDGELEAAEGFCELILKNDPESAVAWGLLGLVMMLQNRGDEALPAFERSIKIDKTNGTTWMNYGSLLSYIGRLNDAESALIQSTTLDPNNYAVWFLLGNVYKLTNRPKLAEDAYRKAIELKPSDEASWSNLGFALYDQKLYQDAEKMFRKAIELNPRYAFPWRGLGYAFAKRKQFKDAAHAFRQYLNFEPQDGEIWNELGIILRELGQTDGELEAYQNATRFTPNDANAWHNVGLVFRSRGQLHEAEKAYRKAVEIDPTQKASWSGLHSVLIEMGGRVEEAQYAYVRGSDVIVRDKDTGKKKVMDIPEDLARTVAEGLTTMAESLNKGYALMSEGRFDEAEKIFRHVIRNYPDNPRSKLLLADLLVERGKCKEALPMIEEAIKAVPTAGYPWAVRGRALGKLGRMKEAKESMKRALQIEPHNRMLKMDVDYWFREQGMR